MREPIVPTIGIHTQGNIPGVILHDLKSSGFCLRLEFTGGGDVHYFIGHEDLHAWAEVMEIAAAKLRDAAGETIEGEAA